MPLGDAALLVTMGDASARLVPSRAAAARARQVAADVQQASLAGVVDVVPAYATLAVYFDPGRAAFDALRDSVAALIQERSGTEPELTGDGRLVEIPVVYDGPDLAEVARAAGLDAREVAALHAGREYYAYLLGFVPGFAYLGDLEQRLVLPRRATPRPHVPAGSVAIAGTQTAVYPRASPGGWHLIGRTDSVLFDPAREPAGLIAPGDRVRFVYRAASRAALRPQAMSPAR